MQMEKDGTVSGKLTQRGDEATRMSGSRLPCTILTVSGGMSLTQMTPVFDRIAFGYAQDRL